MTDIHQHQIFMDECLQLAEISRANGESPVGSILVSGNEIIGKGAEAVTSTKDITNHAEIQAIRDAIANGHLVDLKDSILYSTHEPCWMCSYAIRHYAIPTVIFSTPVAGIGGYTSKFPILNTADIPQWKIIPEIHVGINPKG